MVRKKRVIFGKAKIMVYIKAGEPPFFLGKDAVFLSIRLMGIPERRKISGTV